jgi:hypothetical protein
VERVLTPEVGAVSGDTALFWSRWPRRHGQRRTRPIHDKKNIWRLCKTYGRLIGVPELKPHDLRDGVAMEVLERNHDLEEVRALPGHTRLDTTQIYAIRPAQLKRAVAFYEDKAARMLSEQTTVRVPIGHGPHPDRGKKGGSNADDRDQNASNRSEFQDVALMSSNTKPRTSTNTLWWPQRETPVRLFPQCFCHLRSQQSRLDSNAPPAQAARRPTCHRQDAAVPPAIPRSTRTSIAASPAMNRRRSRTSCRRSIG